MGHTFPKKLQKLKGKLMLKTEQSMVLIAKWKTDQNPSVDRPYAVHWVDGRPASYEDYLTHIVDTHNLYEAPDGMELHMFPDIVGEVKYNHSARRWYISGTGVMPTLLSLTDLNSPDDQILAELYSFPVVYRVRIHR